MCGAAMEHILNVLPALSAAPLAPVIRAPPLKREGGGERGGGGGGVGRGKNKWEKVGGAGRV